MYIQNNKQSATNFKRTEELTCHDVWLLFTLLRTEWWGTHLGEPLASLLAGVPPAQRGPKQIGRCSRNSRSFVSVGFYYIHNKCGGSDADRGT